MPQEQQGPYPDDNLARDRFELDDPELNTDERLIREAFLSGKIVNIRFVETEHNEDQGEAE